MEFISGDISHLSRNDQVANIQAGGQKLQDMFASYKANQEPTLGEAFSLGSTNVNQNTPIVDPVSSFTEHDEEQIRRDMIRRFQGQIDATNQQYDILVDDARLEGEGRLGSQRAASARGGLLGSDFAGAQKDKVQGFNRDINRSINAERSVAVASILGEARRSAASEISEKRAARERGAQEYLAFLKGTSERKEGKFNTIISDMINQGIDPNELTPEQLTQIQNDLGRDETDILSAYNRLKVEADAQAAQSANAELQPIIAEAVSGGATAEQIALLNSSELDFNTRKQIAQSIIGETVLSDKEFDRDVESQKLQSTLATQAAQRGNIASQITNRNRQFALDAAEFELGRELDEKERQDLVDKQDAAVGLQVAKAETVLGKVTEALNQATPGATGFSGQVSGKIGGTSAFDLKNTVNTIQGNLGFDQLQAMRDASPTGGALGQVSERELALLISTVSSLDPAQSQDQLTNNLNQVKDHYGKWLETVGYQLAPDGAVIEIID